MKIALVYDRINKIGGAERILQALHEIWPEAPVWTSVYDRKRAGWADGWDIRTSFLQKIPLTKNNHQYLGWLMIEAFESMDLSEFEVVISLTSEAAKAVRTSKKQLHICYLLTPTRYLWSQAAGYWDTIPKWLRPAALAVLPGLRMKDYQTAQRPDEIISISREVRDRCLKYYGRKSSVIYPPGGFVKSGGSEESCRLGIKDYYLVVSRLVLYKRIDLAIKTFNKLKKSLVIVGRGSAERELKNLAGPTIKFTGSLTDKELISYYRRAEALVMPQEEDLGLTAIEAQSLGLPVIAFSGGGAKELIKENITGVFFGEQSAESLAEAVERGAKMHFDEKKCRLNADRFTARGFKMKFKSKIEEIWNRR